MYKEDNLEPIQSHEPIVPEDGVEYFQCVKCNEYNLIKNSPRRRRTKRIRHIRADEVVWSSLKKYASINNVDLNYAVLLLLMNARTNNINYVVNERKLVEKNPS